MIFGRNLLQIHSPIFLCLMHWNHRIRLKYPLVNREKAFSSDWKFVFVFKKKTWTGHPAEIEEIFDSISYSKGSSVIRMLHDYIGDDAFRQGLHNYLKEYSYKNTITVNLWSHLANASKKPVNEVMSTWTLQMVDTIFQFVRTIKLYFILIFSRVIHL